MKLNHLTLFLLARLSVAYSSLNNHQLQRPELFDGILDGRDLTYHERRYLNALYERRLLGLGETDNFDFEKRGGIDLQERNGWDIAERGLYDFEKRDAFDTQERDLYKLRRTRHLPTGRRRFSSSSCQREPSFLA